MQLVYMGIFSAVFDWVLDHIFSPVFDFVGKLLTSLFSWLFNNILGPLLKEVFVPLFKTLFELLYTILAGVLYQGMAALMKLIDTMQKCFDILIGISNVTDTKTGQTGSLLEILYNIQTIRNAFWYITALGLVLALFLTIYAVTKSMFDLDFDNKRTVSKVLTAFFRAALQFLLVPLFVLVMIQFSGKLVGILDTTIRVQSDSTDNSTLGTTIFVVSSLDAAKDDAYNVSKSNDPDIGINDPVRKPFYQRKSDYMDVKAVENKFKFEKFDFFVGYGLCIFMFVTLIACMMIFVQRIFDMLVLYIVSPFFVAQIPLDDGEKFKSWRETFIGKCFSGFGCVIAMRLYLMMCPAIVGNQITFTGMDGSVESAYIFKMLFLLGGAWSVMKSGSMITGLLSLQASRQESQTADYGMGLGLGAASTGGALAWGATKLAGKGIKKLFGGDEKNPKEKLEEKMNSNKEGEDSKDDKNNNAMKDAKKKPGDSKIAGLSGSSSTPKGGGVAGAVAATATVAAKATATTAKVAGKAGVKAATVGAKAAASGVKAAASGTKSAVEGAAGAAKSAVGGAASGAGSAAKAAAGGASGGLKDAAKSLTGGGGGGEDSDNKNKDLKEKDVAAKDQNAEKDKKAADGAFTDAGGLNNKKKGEEQLQNKKPQKGTKILGITFRKNASGKRRPNINLGPFFKHNIDKNGVQRMSILGFSFKWGSDGKMKSWSMPGLKFKKNAGGSFKLNKVSLGPIATVRTNKATGGMYFGDCSLLGIKRRADGEKGEIHTLSAMGFHQDKGADGKYHIQSGPGFFINRGSSGAGEDHCEGFGLNIGGHKMSIYERDNDDDESAGSSSSGGSSASSSSSSSTAQSDISTRLAERNLDDDLKLKTGGDNKKGGSD